MDRSGIPAGARRRVALSALAALMLALPATARAEPPLIVTEGPAAGSPIEPPPVHDPFAHQFVPYAIPEPPLQRPDAVDITAIEPAVPAVVPLGSGIASYYGRRFHGRLTANGERFDMHALTAAHKTLPFGTQVRVINPRNGRSVVVRINDRGPFTPGRTIDLSRAAASQIGLIQRGHGEVELEVIETG